MAHTAMPGCLAVLWLAVCAAACSDDSTRSPGGGKALTREELLNPESCKDCHPKHYREWSGSMHAYAAADPAFLAMNQRGQRETDGELGDFCVQCHAPMAVREMPDADWSQLDVAGLPDHLKGVTCYFCHNAVGVGEHFNADIELANDTTMRGGIVDPVQPKAHKAAFSAYHDRRDVRSSLLCGACHDIVTQKGVHLERTLAEYKETIFSRTLSDHKTLDPASALSCQSCHMDSEKGVAADDPDSQVGSRSIHSHLWPGIDVALTTFPHRDALRSAIEECELPNSIQYFELALKSERGSILNGFVLELFLETSAGHSQPSGASQDRRMWVEMVAYDQDSKVIYQSGTIADDEIEERPQSDPEFDPDLWLFGDRLYDARDNEIHMFWEAERVETIDALPGPVQTTDGIPAPHYRSRSYDLTDEVLNLGRTPSRVEIRVRMRPMSRGVLQDLVDSGDLEAAVLAEMPTFTVYSAEATWNSADEPGDFQIAETTRYDCERAKCLLDPASCASP